MFDKLLELWKVMEEANIHTEEGPSGYSFYDYEREEVGAVSAELCSLLIDCGSINYDNKLKLTELGFFIFPVERDSFGWLVGACVKKSTKCGVCFG